MTASPVVLKRRSRFALRFSLRVLLIAFTAFAVGFPIWYRWPYEEVVVQGPSGDPFSAVKEARTYTTWQRQWGGGRLKHGPERLEFDGRTSSTQTHRLGKLTGPFQTFYLTGALAEDGQYVDGKKDGICTKYHEDGAVGATFNWQQGALHGPASISGKSGNHQLQFADGRLVNVDRQLVVDRLGALAAADKIESAAIRELLKSVTGYASIDLPLPTVADSMSRVFRVPIIADPLHIDPNLRVNFSGHDLDVASALAAMATLHDLRCDYRYGAIWITSPEDGMDWHDSTGVADIVPPTESQVAASWNEPVTVRATGQPLADVLNQLAMPLAIDVDVSQIQANNGDAASYSVTRDLPGHPFRHALGILLYQTRCRCRLEGESLIILPRE